MRATDVVLDDQARAAFTCSTARPGGVPVELAVHGEHQVGNALAAAAVALECGRDLDQCRRRARRGAGRIGAADGRADSWRRRHGDQRFVQREPGFDAGGAQGARLHGPFDGRERRRSWAVLGEMAELGDESVVEHDAIGRFAVRLDVEQADRRRHRPARPARCIRAR